MRGQRLRRYTSCLTVETKNRGAEGYRSQLEGAASRAGWVVERPRVPDVRVSAADPDVSFSTHISSSKA